MDSGNLMTLVLAHQGETWAHGAWWLWWPLMMTLWFGVSAAMGRFLFRGRRSRGRAGSGQAREILAERFARGELSAEEYWERLAGLDDRR